MIPTLYFPLLNSQGGLEKYFYDLDFALQHLIPVQIIIIYAHRGSPVLSNGRVLGFVCIFISNNKDIYNIPVLILFLTLLNLLGFLLLQENSNKKYICSHGSYFNSFC